MKNLHHGRHLASIAVALVLVSSPGWVTAGAATGVGALGHGRGERLAFLRGTIATTPCGAIYTMNADGSALQRFAGLHAPVCFASWSRDGTKIAFTFAEAGKPGIYTIDSDGSHLRRLTTGPTDSYPTWSPDGARVAFTRMADLYVAHAAGGRLTALTHGAAAQGNDVTAPAWSPDGRRIAFQLGASGTGVFVLALAGRKVTPLGPGGSPSWSPDGKRIVFTHNGRLELSSLDGRKALTSVPGDAPAWSQDGRRFAFYRHTTRARSAVYVMNVDGSGVHRLTQGPYDANAVWIPG